MTEHKQLQNCISSINEIEGLANLPTSEKEKMKQVSQIHPMRISKYYMSLINWDDPKDPIRKMAVPSPEELNLEGFYDTSGEAGNTKMPGLQHKYSETALILATNRCAAYCRHWQRSPCILTLLSAGGHHIQVLPFCVLRLW